MRKYKDILCLLLFVVTCMLLASMGKMTPRSPKPYFFGSPHTAIARYWMGPGEYTNIFVDRTNGRVYQYEGGVPNLFANPLHAWKVAGGAHHSLILDSAGNVWGRGDNSVGEIGDGTTTDRASPVQVLTDSLGNSFGGVIDIGCGGTTNWTSWAVTSSGKLYAWGTLTMGTRANNTYGGQTNRPVQIIFPAGVFIVKAIVNELSIALDSDGNVWTWGAEGVGGGFWTPFILAQGKGSGYITRVPTKITLPAPAVQIAGGNEFTNYALLNNGQLYGWGFNLQYIGISGKDLSFYGYNPTRVTDSLGLTAGTIDSITVNALGTYILKTDSTAWGWGSNACGNFGVGPGIDYQTYRTGNVPGGTLSPWNFDQGSGQAMILKPVQIAPGMHNFVKMFTSLAFCYALTLENHASDGNDSLIIMGRNKYQVTNQFTGEIDSTAESIGSTYPNNFDENWARFVNPWRTGYVVRATSRQCKVNGSSPLCTISPNQYDNSKPGPTSLVGANQTISTNTTTLFGSWIIASGVRGRLNSLWSCTAKPVGAPNPIFLLASSDTTKVFNLTTIGTYTFKHWVEDANFKSDSTTMTVTVTGGGIPPTVNAGVDQSINAPASVTTLTGTATANGGATITTIAWSQISGPNTAAVTTPTILTTNVSSLIPGIYVFRLTITDSNGNSSSDDVQITVNAVSSNRQNYVTPKRYYHLRIRP